MWVVIEISTRPVSFPHFYLLYGIEKVLVIGKLFSQSQGK